jgi:hypothetical protein
MPLKVTSTPYFLIQYQKSFKDGGRSNSHRGGPGSRPGPSVWDLWWSEGHSDRIFLRVIRISPVSIIPPWLHTHV